MFFVKIGRLKWKIPNKSTDCNKIVGSFVWSQYIMQVESSYRFIFSSALSQQQIKCWKRIFSCEAKFWNFNGPQLVYIRTWYCEIENSRNHELVGENPEKSNLEMKKWTKKLKKEMCTYIYPLSYILHGFLPDVYTLCSENFKCVRAFQNSIGLSIEKCIVLQKFGIPVEPFLP